VVEMFHWSLREIDETDLESLIPFIFHYPKWKEERKTGYKAKRIYADQANWLN
jgi:hypothetical protein